MKSETTALLLLGFQKELFEPGGRLFKEIESPARLGGIRGNVVRLLERLQASRTLVLSLPLALAPDTAESYYLRGLIEPSAREAVALLDRVLPLLK